jgi:hypothetical protein
MDFGGGPDEAPPSRPREESDTGFVRQPMVRWADPSVLVSAGLRVIVSSLFGSYADKREMQAIAPTPPHDYAAGDSLWLDFVADLGDGFDSTYAMACLLARDELRLEDGDKAAHVMPRGRVLVMGGDQVYPVPTRDAYENRFRGPYGAALPWAPNETAPDLYAIPGNHDWYDGLTNFLRFFCAERSIGGWRTRQRRSYFALRLPHRWWLLALDIQLDTYIDDPQLEYFRNVGIKQGDRVILVTGKPSWVKVRLDYEPESYKNLRYFKDKVTRPAGAEVAVTLSGDLHHYCRYGGDDGTQLITSGGGGAYLFPTHTMRRNLSLADEDATYERKTCFPRVDDSKRMAWGALRLSWLAPRLCFVIGLSDAFFAGSMYGWLDGKPAWLVAMVALWLLMTLALVAYAAMETIPGKVLLGAAHAAAQLLVAAVAPILLVCVLDAHGVAAGFATSIMAAVLGFLGGGVVFGIYLVLAHPHAPKHANDVFAFQRIPDYKGFIRMRIDESGVTIYPIGVQRVPRSWELAPDDPPGDPWFTPVDRELRPELIEQPIMVSVG